MSSNECITVVVRCRPMNRKEHEEKRKGIINVDIENRQVYIQNPEAPEEAAKGFTFDATYDENTQQRIFYEESCFSIVESTLEGFNSTIFAYGQTGCGKSFTMQGPSTSDENVRGVIPNSFSHIFQFVKSKKDVEFLIRCSYLELYNEEIRDLLGNPKNPVKCELKEDPNKGVYVKGLCDVVVESPEDLHKMLDKGLNNRTTAATLMNSESSRSHSIFTIIVEMNTKDPETGKDMLRVGKLNLVDLAGSERAKKTGAKDQTLKEGIKINLSLSVLGNVISALSEGAKHIPYRDSKLTRLLQDSLGGNTKTMMVAAISPADYNFEETMSTLRYANRAKNIKNKPKINEDPKDTMIREFKAEIERLRALLASQANGATIMAQFAPPPAQAYAPPPQHHQPMMQQSSQPQLVAHTIETQTQSSNYSQPINHYANATSENHYSTELRVEATTHTTPKQSQPAAEQKFSSPSKSSKLKSANADSGNNDENEDYYEASFEDKDQFNDEPAQQPTNTQNPIVTPRTNDPAILNSPDVEQQLRDEVAIRLQQLEHMLVHHETSTMKLSPVKEAVSQVAEHSSPVKTAAELAAEEEEIRLYNERKQKAKKKQKEKQQREMQRILEEKRVVEEELEELRNASNNNAPVKESKDTSNAVDDNSGVDDKKLSRMKKKYEKKLQQATEEMAEMREEYEYQRKSMLDNVLEQEKDLRLYEIICKSLLSEKDFKKILEKSRYDEESDEWIIPYIKRKQNLDIADTASVSASAVLSGNHNSSNRSSGSSILPDIFPNRQVNPVEKFDQTMKLGKGEGGGGSKSGSGKGGKVPVPLLTLPGSLISASALVSNREANNDDYNSSQASYPHNGYTGFSNYSYSNHSNNNVDRSSARSEIDDSPYYQEKDNLPGIGFDGEKKKKGNKSSSNPNKIPKVPPTNNNNKMPSINGANNSHADYGMNNSDQVGTGEHAGPLDDWGFSKQGSNKQPQQDRESYSDDDDFVTDNNDNAPMTSARNGNGEKKKKKASRQARNSRDNNNSGTDSARGNSSSLPPIDMKHHTPRTSSLPPI